MRGEALEHCLAVGDLQQDLGAGLELAVGLDQRRDQILAGGVHGDHADPRPPLAVGFERSLAALVEQAQDLRRVRLESGAGLGQADAPALALDELGAELTSERGERGRHGRLAHVQLLGGGLDAARAGDGQEGPELRDRDHGDSLSDRSDS